MSRFLDRLRSPTKEASTGKRNPPRITWRHSWSTDETNKGLADSPFRNLPPEVTLDIFKHLSVHDLGCISLTCRSLKMLADQDDVWKVKCNSSTKIRSQSFKEVYMDWMYEKYLRNEELQRVEEHYILRSSQVACGIRCGPPRYPVRPDGVHDFGVIGGFTRHPNESNDFSIDLSVDVDRTARELMAFLEKAAPFQTLWRESSVIKQMITRYYRFMQLKASAPSTALLVPTLDIEIIWQTHLLRPSMYHSDCMRLFHRVIDHSLLSNELEQFLKEKAFVETCQLCKDRFGEEYCPLPRPKDPEEVPAKYEHHVFSSLKCLIPEYTYWDETHFDFKSATSANHDDKPFSFTEADVILDGNWLALCKKFVSETIKRGGVQGYYRYDTSINLGRSTLQRLKKSYERFLYMSTKYSPSNGYGFVHPTYAIDIIWHSHMQEPLKYVVDCNRLVGHLVDHAPWPSVDAEKMKSSCDETAKVWKSEFDSELELDHVFNTKNDGFGGWDDD